jgi:hypothetical protein
MIRVSTLALLALVLPAAAWAAEDDEARWSVGVNAIAPLTVPDAVMTKMMVPLLTGLEYGLAVNGGVHLRPAWSVQARTSLGSPTTLDHSLMPQLQLGTNLHLPRTEPGGPYVGAHVRAWDLYYRDVSEHFVSVQPYAVAGWRWIRGPMFYDLRLSQMLGAWSASSVEHSQADYDFYVSPAPEIYPVLPLMSLDIGLVF